MPGILFIDDRQNELNALVEAVRQFLGEKAVLKAWVPREDNVRAAFEAQLGKDTALVVTDRELSLAKAGFDGATIIGWCQELALPVADYSRALDVLKKEPDLFEIRVPRDDEGAMAAYVAGIFLGFDAINKAIVEDKDFEEERSPAAALAGILGVPEAEADFALYSIRLGATSGALTSRVMKSVGAHPEEGEKRRLLAYIVGHFLLNSVLRYPGPILSLAALKAYLASDAAGDERVLQLFKTARYSGPFADLDTYHWLSKVDDLLYEMIPENASAETNGELNRMGVERRLKTELVRHDCPERCKGQNGGYYCPFTKRTVCTRSDCSVGSNGWIPQGALLCRIERGFFEDWSQLLGL